MVRRTHLPVSVPGHFPSGSNLLAAGLTVECWLCVSSVYMRNYILISSVSGKRQSVSSANVVKLMQTAGDLSVCVLSKFICEMLNPRRVALGGRAFGR